MKTVANYTTTTVLPTPDPNMSFVETRYTNPDRTEVTDGSSNWLATFTDGSRSVVMKGPTRVFMEHDMPLWDDFDRVRTGWGVLTRNGSWSLSGSADSSNSAVNSGVGTMTATATGTSYRATVITHAIQDADVRACVQIDTQATGATTTAGLITGYQDTSNHYIARVDLQAPDAAVTDDFSRNTTDGWGTATSGQSWTITGTAGDYSTTGTVGQHTLTALNVSKRSYTGSGTDFDCMVKISTSDIAAGGSLNGGIIGRYIDTNNHYIFRIRFGTTQA
ncbi:hypothetical protein KDA14_04590, partial [Candidatus Saccharibacteria bacterium]|nr:hypothetical protein [Candidatus Saccharibacteria bacterium]